MTDSSRKRVVIAGLGDTGSLVAMGLHERHEVVGVSTKPGLVSGQELGVRLARPDEWRENYAFAFERFRKLDGMRTVHGEVVRIEPENSRLQVRSVDGHLESFDYDALVLATGVTNGFWRTADVEDEQAVRRRIDEPAETLRRARSIAVVGGGASGVGAASNLKQAHPGTRVTLVVGPTGILPGYAPRVRAAVLERLRAQGVELRLDHRALLPEGFHGERITAGPVRFVGGEPALEADAVVWTVGRQRPNTGFLPREFLDASGYVRVDANLRVPGTANVFAVGDVAASDPHRSSARNDGHRIVAHNVRCLLEGRADRMRPFRAAAHRWGSIFGPQADGLRVYAPNGLCFRIPPFVVRHLLFPIVVRRGIYGGIRAATRD